MKKSALFLLIFSIGTLLFAQDPIMVSGNYNQVDTVKITRDLRKMQSELDNIKYCLGEYYHERKIAWICLGIGTAASGVSTYFYYKGKITQGHFSTYVAGAFGLASLIVFIKADNWIKNASLNISPAGVRINF